MITAIPKKTFLAGQTYTENGKPKSIIAKKGEKMQFSERDAVKFWGHLQFSEADEKKLLALAKQQKLKRIV